jgi:hypothetical protein
MPQLEYWREPLTDDLTDYPREPAMAMLPWMLGEPMCPERYTPPINWPVWPDSTGYGPMPDDGDINWRLMP